MENIRQAVERARGQLGVSAEARSFAARREVIQAPRTVPTTQEFKANIDRLLKRRIVTYNAADRRSRPYDMLRTQIAQSMNQNGWKILGVTSPTPGCGKTLTAINLAFSMARQPNRSTALVDLDLRKPQIEASFGIKPANNGMLDLLEERLSMDEVIVSVSAQDQRISVLPTVSTKDPSRLMDTSAMSTVLQELRQEFQTVILDLPPMLACDDVIRILPQIDCVLLVAAVGHSKVSEVEECASYLQTSHLVRLVLNKSPETGVDYYY